MLFHSCAVSQLNWFPWIKCPHLPPQIGDSCWHWICVSDHQLTFLRSFLGPIIITQETIKFLIHASPRMTGSSSTPLFYFILYFIYSLIYNPHPRACLFVCFICLFVYLKERGRSKERETSTRERNICQLPSVCTLTMGQTCNLGMCPDWESNPQPFGVGDNAPTNWATQPGLELYFDGERKCVFMRNWDKCEEVWIISSTWQRLKANMEFMGWLSHGCQGR